MSAVNCTSLPAWVTLEYITAERVDLYRHIPPPGENIPVSVEPFPVEDLVPTEDEIECAVKWIQNHRSGGPSGIRDEHLKGWLAEARKEEVEALKTSVAERKTELLVGAGWEETEERR